MPSNLNPLAIRKRLGRDNWAPPGAFGQDGFLYDRKDGEARVIVTYGPTVPGAGNWVHASISRPDDVPTYADLMHLHRAVWGTEGWSYQVFAPEDDHVNIHHFALHLWGRLDGSPVLPNFGSYGTI